MPTLTPRQPQLTGACSRKPTGTRQALRRAAPRASDLFCGTAGGQVSVTCRLARWTLVAWR